jgi:UPF0042 nucleotide-binding protein
MKLVIVSGRSGSGKSTALNVLEDLGYYCIDNLPVRLLLPLTEEALNSNESRLEKIAISIDARNLSTGLEQFQQIYQHLKSTKINLDIIYLDALDQTLIKRFHSTRRKHPLSSDQVSLKEAIQQERTLLNPLSSCADLVVDTSAMTMYQLRDMIKLRVAGRQQQDMALLFQSFGFKHGVPFDTDYVFDVRCLPNPFWDTALREFTGLDQPVRTFLEARPETEEMVKSLTDFLDLWIPRFENSNRSYLTVSIGCTGGQHRSVYICDRLTQYYKTRYPNVQSRHVELPSS